MATPCSGTVLPPTHADLCVPNVFFGGFTMLMFTRQGDGLDDVEDDTEWDTRIDNAAAIPGSGLAPIRQVFGTGGLGKPDRNTINISRKRTISSDPKYSFVFKVDDTGDTNWAFLVAIPISGQPYSAWPATEERIFGGNSGIDVVIYGDPNIPDNPDEIMTIDLTVTFQGAVPAVNDNPL